MNQQERYSPHYSSHHSHSFHHPSSALDSSDMKPQSQWSILLPLPEHLRSTMLNYLNFFREFARVTHGLEVMIDSATERGAVAQSSQETQDTQSAAGVIHRVRCMISSLNASQERVSALLAEYVKRVFAHPAHDGELEIHTAASRYESDLFLILYKRALADIRTDVRFRLLMLSDAEREAMATSFALLSVSAAAPEETSVQQMMRAMEALQLPSERIEVPPSLYQTLHQAQQHGAQSAAQNRHQQQLAAEHEQQSREHSAAVQSSGVDEIAGERLDRLRYALADLADELDRSSLLVPTLNRRFAMVIEDVEDLLAAASECAKKGEPLEGVWRVQMLVERALNLALRSEHEEIIAVVRSAARAVSELVEESGSTN